MNQIKYQMFCFPTPKDGQVAIEKALLNLEQREKAGEDLDQVERDWIEYASWQLLRKF